MSLGARIKEERQRLGLNQTDFAALAGASRRAMVNWETDGAAPSVAALIAWADAGADALYILTGQRTGERPQSAGHTVAQNLAGIHRDLLEPTRNRLAGEDDDQAEERVLQASAMALRYMLKYDAQLMEPADIERAANLLDIATSPKKLTLFRAADFAQMRKKRDQMRQQIGDWIDLSYEPNETVRNILVTMAIDYAVPVRLLAELLYETFTDITERRQAREAQEEAEKPPT